MNRSLILVQSIIVTQSVILWAYRSETEFTLFFVISHIPLSGSARTQESAHTTEAVAFCHISV